MRRIVLISIFAIIAISTVVYAQVSSITIGSFVLVGGGARTINSDDLLTVQQGDTRYLRAGAAQPSPSPTPVPAATPFKAILTVSANGTASASIPPAMTVCVPYDRSGNTIQLLTGPPNLTLKAVGPTVNLICY